ncbi:MAG: hypothetical protein H6629_12135 [Calditrichae bacterium]|nr:hypothetical protein [Calditrichia bacterium]
MSSANGLVCPRVQLSGSGIKSSTPTPGVLLIPGLPISGCSKCSDFPICRAMSAGKLFT